MSHRLRFFKRYLSEPTCVGAVAPSSRALADALCDPFRKRTKPATVLEVGAGTGPITRRIGALMGSKDRLDICEIQPEFADFLEQTVLNENPFVSGVAEGRVQVIRSPIQDLPEENKYDYVISGLPLTAFALRDVNDVFKVIRRSLKPGGVLSYFEYVGLRRTFRLLAVGSKRKRRRMLSAYLTRNIRRHQFARQTVLGNFPPAYARHFRFDRDGLD